MMGMHTALAGIDFTSRPSRRKPIIVALGHRAGDVVVLEQLHACATFDAFSTWLRTPGPWIGAFDFPFGLPRELVQALQWPMTWRALIDHYASFTREQIRTTFAAFCEARPAGGKFAHRACDAPAGSSSSMKWVNPPVAYMLHAGVPLLLEAGVHFVGLHAGDSSRVVLEAYPGLLARELIGRRSYKNDAKVKQTPERLIARKALIEALEQGHTRLGLRLRLTRSLHEALLDDASGDRLDAALCLMQAGWAASQPNFGQPVEVDPLEGWIVSAGVWR